MRMYDTGVDTASRTARKPHLTSAPQQISLSGSEALPDRSNRRANDASPQTPLPHPTGVPLGYSRLSHPATTRYGDGVLRPAEHGCCSPRSRRIVQMKRARIVGMHRCSTGNVLVWPLVSKHPHTDRRCEDQYCSIGRVHSKSKRICNDWYNGTPYLTCSLRQVSGTAVSLGTGKVGQRFDTEMPLAVAKRSPGYRRRESIVIPGGVEAGGDGSAACVGHPRRGESHSFTRMRRSPTVFRRSMLAAWTGTQVEAAR